MRFDDATGNRQTQANPGWPGAAVSVVTYRTEELLKDAFPQLYRNAAPFILHRQEELCVTGLLRQHSNARPGRCIFGGVIDQRIEDFRERARIHPDRGAVLGNGSVDRKSTRLNSSHLGISYA